MRLFLDESVPMSVGRTFAAASHEVMYLRDNAPAGTEDPLVCAIAKRSGAILVAIDGDMRHLAKRHNVGRQRFRTLSLIKLSCRETRAAGRIHEAMSLIEHEWHFGIDRHDRRIFIEVGDEFIKTIR